MFMDRAQVELVNTIDNELLILEPNPNNRVAIGKTVDQSLSNKGLGGEKGYGRINYQTALNTIDVLVAKHEELHVLDLSEIRESIITRRDTSSVGEEKRKDSVVTEGNGEVRSGKNRRRRISSPKGIVNKALATAALVGITGLLGGAGVAFSEFQDQNSLSTYASVEGRAEITSDLQTAILDLSNAPAHQEPVYDAFGVPTSMVDVPARGPDTGVALRELNKVQSELRDSGPRFQRRVLSVETTLFDATKRSDAELAPQRFALRTMSHEIPSLANFSQARQYASDQRAIDMALPVTVGGLFVAAGSGVGYVFRGKFTPRARK